MFPHASDRKSFFPASQELYLSNNYMGDIGAIHLGAVFKCHSLPALEILTLDRNTIGEMGMKALVEGFRVR